MPKMLVNLSEHKLEALETLSPTLGTTRTAVIRTLIPAKIVAEALCRWWEKEKDRTFATNCMSEIITKRLREYMGRAIVEGGRLSLQAVIANQPPNATEKVATLFLKFMDWMENREGYVIKGYSFQTQKEIEEERHAILTGPDDDVEAIKNEIQQWLNEHGL